MLCGDSKSLDNLVKDWGDRLATMMKDPVNYMSGILIQSTG
jgi:hypothetical protein